MATWRTKASILFGCSSNRYSYTRGKLELFADLIAMAQDPECNSNTLNAIAEYVTWASAQASDDLASAVDLAFFKPLFETPSLEERFSYRLPRKLLDAKRALFFQ